MIRLPYKPFMRRSTSLGVTKIVRDNYGPDWRTISAEVKKRDNYRCVQCRTPEDPSRGIYHHVHHIKELSRGGTTTKANLITLCERHHKQRHPGNRHL